MIVNTIMRVLNVIKIMCSYCNVYVIMQQVHLSTLEKILYCNVQVSGQDYNVQVKHWLHEVHPIIYENLFNIMSTTITIVQKYSSSWWLTNYHENEQLSYYHPVLTHSKPYPLYVIVYSNMSRKFTHISVKFLKARQIPHIYT